MGRHISALTRMYEAARNSGPSASQQTAKIDANDLIFVSTILSSVEAKKIRATTIQYEPTSRGGTTGGGTTGTGR